MFHDTKLYEDAYDEAIKNNEKALAEIEQFKKELEGVKQNLEENQKHLFQQIMAPLAGGKALIKAKLVRTNDIMVFLGDKWFLRTSSTRAIGICNRKIERCSENIVEIERQTKRFCSNIEKAREYEMFSNEGLQEIVEPYDDEAEKLWREKHREKVSKFKKQEAVERNLYKTEEFLQKIERLEQDEVDLESDVSEDESDSESDLSEEETYSHHENHSMFDCTIMADQSAEAQKTQSFFNLAENGPKSQSVPNVVDDSPLNSVNLSAQASLVREKNKTEYSCVYENPPTKEYSSSKKRVSFSNTDELKSYSPLESLDAVDTNVIRFKHSEKVASHSPGVDDQIHSPSDFLRTVTSNYNLKSILRKEPQVFAEESSISDLLKLRKMKCGFSSDDAIIDRSKNIVIGDIVEKSTVEIAEFEKPSRQLSKFRKSRNKLP